MKIDKSDTVFQRAFLEFDPLCQDWQICQDRHYATAKSASTYMPEVSIVSRGYEF